MITGEFVEHPGMRRAPPDLLRQLRELDPTFELAYLGNGKWLPFVKRPLDSRQEAARKELDAMYKRIPVVLAALPPEKRARMREVYALKEVKLKRFAEGYQHLNEVFTFPGEPDSRIVDWYRAVLHRARSMNESQKERDQEQRSEKPEDGPLTKLFEDEDRAKDAYKDAFSGAHSVTIHDNPLAEVKDAVV